MGSGVSAWLVDTSVWHRSQLLVENERWVTLQRERLLATCAVVVLELLYSCRNAAEVAATEQAMALLQQAPVTPIVVQRSLTAIRQLAEQRTGYHRLGASDALIAACAAESGMGVLHYDRHFERLGAVLAIETRWVADPGTL